LKNYTTFYLPINRVLSPNIKDTKPLDNLDISENEKRIRNNIQFIKNDKKLFDLFVNLIDQGDINKLKKLLLYIDLQRQENDINKLIDYLEMPKEQIYFQDNLKELTNQVNKLPNFSSNMEENDLNIDLSDDEKNNSYRIYSLIAKSFGIDVNTNQILSIEDKNFKQIDQDIF